VAWPAPLVDLVNLLLGVCGCGILTPLLFGTPFGGRIGG
jgi:hypothetical protein